MSFFRDLRVAFHSLMRTQGLAITVILTLALGIGANAATEGAVMAGAGVLAGAALGFVAARLAGSYFPDVKMPGVLPVVLSAFVLPAAAVVASMVPAARAARIDVIQALRSE